jgi:hypothetical protein
MAIRNWAKWVAWWLLALLAFPIVMVLLVRYCNWIACVFGGVC